MLERREIQRVNDPLFAHLWELYVDAFPQAERRSKEYQEETMKRSSYHLEAILNNDEFVGFIGWWSFGQISFIEHFATLPHLRGQGVGRKALESFIAQSNREVILEVEHPTTQLSERRIGFYERIGFTLNDYCYSHPSYTLERAERVELLIMSYPRPLSCEQFESFSEFCFRDVHFIHG